ncbi:MAG: bactofilin family protein [Brevinema sp.]
MNSQRVSNKNNIIGEGSTFEGVITIDGSLRVDGQFLGKDLNLEHVVIGKNGRVRSLIEADSVIVEGTVLGDIKAKIRAMLLPTARISGDISTPELIIQNGVMWDGHCRISSSPQVDVVAEVNKAFQ